MRTPETLTATQREARLRALDPGSWPSSDQAVPHPPHENSMNSSLDRARASLMSTLSQRPSASAHLDPRMEIDGAVTILSIDDIDFYEHNPRVSKNPKYAELRQSIAADGITNILTVTRRPGGTRYFPYGGGNTRLAIAKELHAEGDSRFAQLRVAIKAWKSEFDVVAAHLVENENRGDTSFWEKALGVQSFKEEFEKEHPEQSLIGSELHRELNKRGMNFGVRMIQNFMFAIEFLRPIGPWLRAFEVNMTLRPRLSGFLDVAGRFDKSDEAAQVVLTYLQTTASGLRELEERNRLRDPSEHVPVELEAARVVRDLAQALADLLGLERPGFERMGEAIAADPRLQSSDLLALRPPASASVSAPAGSADRETFQAPASPALEPAGAASHRPPVVPPSSAPVQMPLSPMAGVVGGAEARQPSELQREHPGRAGDVGADPHGAHPAVEHTVAVRRARLRDQMVQAITEINGVVPIHDFMLAIDSMPFGFFADIPENLARIGDVEVSSQMERRGMLWHFLASMSGQLHEQHWRAVADDPLVQATRWARERAQGAMPFARVLGESIYAACGLVDREQGVFELHIPANVLWTLLSDPELGALLSRVMELRRSLQQLEPDRHMLRGVQLRFTPVVETHAARSTP